MASDREKMRIRARELAMGATRTLAECIARDYMSAPQAHDETIKVIAHIEREYALATESPSLPDVGRRVKVIGDHPRRGSVGVVSGYKSMVGRRWAIISGDNGDKCYVYWPENVEYV